MHLLLTILFLWAVIAVITKTLPSASQKPPKLKQAPADPLPYTKQKSLLTPAERSFMGALKLALEGEVEITTKVRLADVITTKKGIDQKTWRSARNRIERKHLDFVICDPDDYSIYCAIELDDKSHQQQKRIERDQFLDDAMNTAKIPLHRFPVQHTYSIQEIRTKLIGKSAESDEKYYANCEAK